MSVLTAQERPVITLKPEDNVEVGNVINTADHENGLVDQVTASLIAGGHDVSKEAVKPIATQTPTIKEQNAEIVRNNAPVLENLKDVLGHSGVPNPEREYAGKISQFTKPAANQVSINTSVLTTTGTEGSAHQVTSSSTFIDDDVSKDWKTEGNVFEKLGHTLLQKTPEWVRIPFGPKHGYDSTRVALDPLMKRAENMGQVLSEPLKPEKN